MKIINQPFKARRGRIGKCKCGGELVAVGIQMDWVVDLQCLKCRKVYKLD